MVARRGEEEWHLEILVRLPLAEQVPLFFSESLGGQQGESEEQWFHADGVT